MVFKVDVDLYNVETQQMDTVTYQMDYEPSEEWVKSLNTQIVKVDGVTSKEM